MVRLDCPGGKPGPSVGVTPTVGPDAGRQVEAYLLDFSGDLRGMHLDLRLLEWIRPQRRFESIAQLRSAIEDDIRYARKRRVRMGQNRLASR